MSPSVALFLRIGYGKRASRLLGQRGRRAPPGRREGSPSLSDAADPLLPPGGGGACSAAKGPPSGLARLVLPLLSGVKRRSSDGAGAAALLSLSLSLSLCLRLPLRSSDSLRSSRSPRTGSKMLSTTSTATSTASTASTPVTSGAPSSGAGEGQGKARAKPTLHKRGSLQSATVPATWPYTVCALSVLKKRPLQHSSYLKSHSDHLIGVEFICSSVPAGRQGDVLAGVLGFSEGPILLSFYRLDSNLQTHLLITTRPSVFLPEEHNSGNQ
ncbi:unnamed protein product [Boreogadus saida]